MSDFIIIKKKQEVILTYKQEKIDFFTEQGVENEKVLDISNLRSLSGLITLDPGFKNTGACKSAVCFLDGEAGKLLYRGYRVEQLAQKCSFLEVSYLLIRGELPTKDQLVSFSKQVNEFSFLDKKTYQILEALPQNLHPMGMLSCLLSSLSAFEVDTTEIESKEEIDLILTKLVALFPILVASIYRKKRGLDPVTPDLGLDYSSNTLKMFFGKEPKNLEADILDKLLILHAEHEQNCSTSTVRLVGSARSNLHACISSGINALWGKLHGGANEAVIEMLESISKGGGVEKIDDYIKRAKDKNDPFRLMGFGHRVYKNFDPRSNVIKKKAHSLLSSLGTSDPLLEIAKNLEEKALKDPYFVDRKLYPNVDFYSGIIYKALGIPSEMFTVLFALGRLPGWMAHWKEVRLNKEPIGRPRQLYVGASQREI